MAKFVASVAAKEWLPTTPVSKKVEIESLLYLKKHQAPDDTILQLHHLPNHKESFDARRAWLIDELKRSPVDLWEELAVNKIVGARLIFMAQEHQRLNLKDDDGIAWYRLISAAKKKYPQ